MFVMWLPIMLLVATPPAGPVSPATPKHTLLMAPRDFIGAPKRLSVEINGAKVAGFFDVSGVSSEADTGESPPDFAKGQMPSKRPYQRITLSRQASNDQLLYAWFKSKAAKNVTLSARLSKGRLWRAELFGCKPLSYAATAKHETITFHCDPGAIIGERR